MPAPCLAAGTNGLRCQRDQEKKERDKFLQDAGSC